MSIKIFEQDPYVFEFEASVTSVNGDVITLDATAFYPGGGGQVNDLGKICGLDVKNVEEKGNDILHSVPGHKMKVDDKIWCSVDWERRYDLMKGHTAEHLLFGALSREIPEMNIVKIFISPESKYVIVDRDVDWDTIKKAQEFVNNAISDNLGVAKSTMGKDDLEEENIRAKLERIDTEYVTVVEIGDVDAAACSGIHVRETGEIEMLLVDRKVSAGKGEYAIHFRIGKDAMERATELANICLQTADTLGTKSEDLIKAAHNIRSEKEALASQLKKAMAHILNTMQPSLVNGVAVYSGIFETSDRQSITDAAERIKNSGGVCILVSVSDTVSVVVSSGTERVDSSKILKEAMTQFGGRGGGKSDFAQGGMPDVSKDRSVMDHLIRSVENTLKRGN